MATQGIYFTTGTRVALDFSKMETRLLPKLFVRAHKKNIINLLYLEEIHPRNLKTDNNHPHVSLMNGHRLDMSRRKASCIEHVRGFQQELNSMIERA